METQSKTSLKTSLGLKMQYAFAIYAVTYFVVRCVASWWFGV